jgi:hypothetical protein
MRLISKTTIRRSSTPSNSGLQPSALAAIIRRRSLQPKT